MKSKFVFSAAVFIASSSAVISAPYVFSGGSDLSVPGNYLLAEGTTSFIAIDSYHHAGDSGFVLPSGNFEKPETLPASYNWLGIGDYSGAEIESSPADLRLSCSNLIDMGGWYAGSRLQTVFAYGSGRDVVLSLGSADSADESVTYYTATLRVVMEDDSASFTVARAPDAAQKIFGVNADGSISVRSGTANFGTVETGALDSITGGIEVRGGATLNVYAKKIGDGGKSRGVSVAGVFNFKVAEISEGEALLSFGGACSTQGGMINFDFTDFNLGGGEYDLIRADAGFSLNGVPEDLSMDFGIIGLDPARCALSLADSGTVLRLAVVPEPAAFAALLGAFALALAAGAGRR